jgi:hypothetical protein
MILLDFIKRLAIALASSPMAPEYRQSDSHLEIYEYLHAYLNFSVPFSQVLVLVYLRQCLCTGLNIKVLLIVFLPHKIY